MIRFSQTVWMLFLAILIGAVGADAGSPAARVGDVGQPGFHSGSQIVNGGSSVLINGQLAARVGSATTCPQICLIPFPLPHSAGNVTSGSSSVFINGVPATHLGGTIIEPGTPGLCQPVHSIASGSSDVFIGP